MRMYDIIAKKRDKLTLSKEEIEALSQALPEKERLSRQYGQFISSSTSLFGDYNPKIHIIEPFMIPADWRRYVAVDYGFDMSAALWFAVSPEKKVYCYDEIHIPNLLISEFSEKILEKEALEESRYNQKLHYTRFCPPDFRKRSHQNGETWYDTFRENGILLRETSNKREYGWSCVRELFRVFINPDNENEVNTSLYIFKNCTVLSDHILKAQVDPDRPSDILDKTEADHYITHILDALRYFAVSYYRPNPQAKQSETRIQRIKRKKIQQMRREENAYAFYY